ncbi:MAG TPA: bifunctional demethylmenaquinone methyltransferase/2-methoxy-6-polyprenyl-1,4-benzoquinol methylase UbiE [Verrucomicrobiae bacterium]|jgi:demethylmenaquinone methyltransferase/2-methoxy-6-polyprenyl-1,4-benzoquinol methylase|nr:bifunctional demethylmenaquinone methyltransferase/2-methoxy-6-polyprenyl-1,4-benzoquinol methylase UbiE [Verrucomicrobiae bacterium]
MANEFYQPGEQRAAKVNALFTAIAPRYDLINDLQSFGLHRRWKRRVLELAATKSTDAALDICCGTGDIAFSLAATGAAVTGLDFSEAMLQVAEQRRADGSNADKNLKFIRGDAQQLPFPDSSFDVVTVGYGLRNLSSWETGVSEMARVAKPGARIISLDFGKPDNALWRSVYFGYLRLFVPLLGLVFCRNASAYAYILESLKHYPAQRGVAEKMRSLGLANVQIYNILGGAMSINYGEKPKRQ